MRAQLRRLKVPQLVAAAAAFRRSPGLTTPTAATKLALKSIAMRYQHLSAEINELDQHLDQLVAAAAPTLVSIKGVGTDIASTLLTIAGDNPERLASEGAFAHLVGHLTGVSSLLHELQSESNWFARTSSRSSECSETGIG